MRSITVAALALLFVLAPLDRAVAQTGHDLLQQALVRERANGDLRGAIAIYERIVREFTADRPLAANALVQLGSCYERLGSTEAERAYQRVVREFGDQTEFVAQARTRLAGLRTAAAPARGPAARRVLSAEDTHEDDFNLISTSLDGRRVAYVRMSDGGVYVRDLASGDVQRLAAGLPAVFHWYPPKWSADGRRLAVATVDQATKVTVIELIDVATHAAVGVPGTRTQGEGSINPAEWSRDGRFLLCARGRRLVLIALDGGTETTLADSVLGRHGSLSPDGRFVAYAVGAAGDSRVFVQPVAGGPPRLISSPQGASWNPVWSPDGRAIAYAGGNGIWVVPMTEGTASGAPRLALVTGTISLRAWTESGLYYTAWGHGEPAPYQLQMDVATGGSAGAVLQGLPGRHPDQFQVFAWSPDMQRVAFVNNYPPAISVYSADRAAVDKVDLGTGGFALRPWWSVDGREVLVHRMRQGIRDSVSALDAATGQLRTQVAIGHAVSYSTDGRTMAFWRWATDSSPYRISEVVVATVGASDERVVATPGGAGEPGISFNVWPWLSPEGSHVLFVRQDRQIAPDRDPGPGTLWVVGSDGRGTRQLATAARITSAVWDPSGRFIAYTSTASIADSARTVLRVVEIGTGVERQIPLPATFPSDVSVTDWSRDGRLLGLVATTYIRDAYWVVQGLLEGGR
jgi:Tol biopolymer transport system component